jgi:flagellin
MSLVLNTNLSSLVAQNNLTSSGAKLATALQQLSSGLRINTAADDAAGYAITQSMTSQINGINQATRNANDGVSLAQTASGALQEVTNDLQKMRDLAVQSLNATNSATDRTDLDAQFQQLKADIDSVATQTQFNGVSLLDGTFQGASFQVGANAGQTITVSSIGSSKSNSIGTIYAGKLSVVGTVTLAGQTTGTATVAGVAGAYSPTGLAATGAAGGLGTAVNGSTVSLKVTVDGTAYTTGAISLTGTAATDLKSVAAAVNQAISPVGGLVATVNSAGTAIQISGTATAGAGHIVDFAVSSATDASGAAIATPGTGTLTALGVDDHDIVGTYTAAGTTTTTTASTLSSLDVKSVDNSNQVLVSIDAALQTIATSGAQLGAYQNRFQAAITGLTTNSTNLTAARSQIQDTDYAQATSALSKAQILQQAGTAMVAQANTSPQNILTLLQKLP